jgi:hypothetical protein
MLDVKSLRQANAIVSDTYFKHVLCYVPQTEVDASSTPRWESMNEAVCEQFGHHQSAQGGDVDKDPNIFYFHVHFYACL